MNPFETNAWGDASKNVSQPVKRVISTAPRRETLVVFIQNADDRDADHCGRDQDSIAPVAGFNRQK